MADDARRNFQIYLSPAFRTIEWRQGKVVMLDQRRLPEEEVYLELERPEAVASAIRDLVIRGAPAIGVAAAMGFALASRCIQAQSGTQLIEALIPYKEMLMGTRPTAVNLQWALQRLWEKIQGMGAEDPEHIRGVLEQEAQRVYEEDILTNADIGKNGAGVVSAGARILTHCNAGALATAGYGTALGVIRAAHREGKGITVLADETRPFLQGARLTAWELHKDGIPVAVITDNMAGYFMRRGEVSLVIVGADRIAANGDVANKIGTYALAVLAHQHEIPFYVAAPLSTFDPRISTGEDIPIEERDPDEVLHWGDKRTAPEGVGARYPAFDVTPHGLITGIITERGVLTPPFEEKIRSLFSESAGRG